MSRSEPEPDRHPTSPGPTPNRPPALLRRTMLVAAGASAALSGLGLLLPFEARAHHGWSSFDLQRPLWLSGRASQVQWRNPHAELVLELDADLRVPPDLASRRVPAQTASVDGPRLLAAAALPTRRDPRWQVELAPLTRMQAWSVPAIQNGQSLAVLGYTFEGERGEPILRAEYLFLGDRIYGLRSSPA